MIKKNVLARFATIIAAGSLFVSAALPQAYGRDGIGFGASVGEPTGVSVKYWLDQTTAFDAACAWSLTDNSPFQLHADYLIHGSSLTTSSSEIKGSLPWYYGIGGRVKNINNKSHIGVRVPVGVTYLLAEAPIDIFGEITPVLDLKPSINLNWNAAIGVRYYFH